MIQTELAHPENEDGGVMMTALMFDASVL
jgi:hypothetical protein